jgi:tol-pal system protein YbgF
MRLGGERYGRVEPAEQGAGFVIGGADPEPASGFGSTTIEPENGTPRHVASAQPNAIGMPETPATGGATRAAAISSPQVRALFDQAQAAMTQRNYRVAAANFEEFVRRYPNDPLAGEAQFWLGEAAFISGEYRKAADSFLKSSTNHPNGPKAAEALLKLGISLKRLGEKDAACSSFAEVARRYPNAGPILQRAEVERRRTNC